MSLFKNLMWCAYSEEKPSFSEELTHGYVEILRRTVRMAPHSGRLPCVRIM
jgi:hypothetical protein